MVVFSAVVKRKFCIIGKLSERGGECQWWSQAKRPCSGAWWTVLSNTTFLTDRETAATIGVPVSRVISAMGLIGDRKSKKQKEKEKEIEKLKNAQNKSKSPLKKGVVSPMGGGMMVGRYPAGYYTTPAPQSSSWAHQVHPGQPRHQAHLNPRYQTWVAPRKQPHLGQLVSACRGRSWAD